MHEKCDRIVHTAAPRESNFDIVESCTVNIGRKSRELLLLWVCSYCIWWESCRSSFNINDSPTLCHQTGL